MSIRPRNAAHRAGFTLLELLAVMVVLGVLVAFLVPNLITTQETAEIKATEVKLTQMATAIDALERDRGTYPPSTFLPEWGVPPNELNVGIECLVLSLWSKNWEAGGQLSPDDLVNTDGDRSAGSISDLPTSQLLEFVDSWDNPIAYIQNSDYGVEHRYLAYDEDGMESENLVKARSNENTGRYANHAKYQLISAGPDGVFGNDDDVYYPTK